MSELTGKEEIIKILMRRDDMDHESAVDLVNDVIEQIENCGGNYEEAVDIIESDLGLEPDYLIYLI